MAAKKGLTKILTESATISTANSACMVRAITLESGTTASSIEILDGGSSGTSKWKFALRAPVAGTEGIHSISFGDGGIICAVDAYGTLAGTGAKAYILYDEIE